MQEDTEVHHNHNTDNHQWDTVANHNHNMDNNQWDTEDHHHQDNTQLQLLTTIDQINYLR